MWDKQKGRDGGTDRMAMGKTIGATYYTYIRNKFNAKIKAEHGQRAVFIQNNFRQDKLGKELYKLGMQKTGRQVVQQEKIKY